MKIAFRFLSAISLLLFIYSPLFAQQKHRHHYYNNHIGTGVVEVAAPPPAILEVICQAPKFPGDVTKYISDHLNYPDNARENNIEGIVQVRFIIDELGKPINISIARPLNYSLNMEAMRIIVNMPAWKPAKINGHASKWPMLISIVFRLQE